MLTAPSRMQSRLKRQDLGTTYPHVDRSLPEPGRAEPQDRPGYLDACACAGVAGRGCGFLRRRVGFHVAASPRDYAQPAGRAVCGLPDRSGGLWYLSADEETRLGTQAAS